MDLLLPLSLELASESELPLLLSSLPLAEGNFCLLLYLSFFALLAPVLPESVSGFLAVLEAFLQSITV